MTLSTRYTDELLRTAEPGTAAATGYRAAGSLEEAKMLVGEAIISLSRGKPLTIRQFALIAWILDPIADGKREGNQLPYGKLKTGRKPGPDFKGELKVLRVEELRSQGMSKEDAILLVAGSDKFVESVRGTYERAIQKFGAEGLRTRLTAYKKSARRLKALVKIWDRKKKNT